MDQSINDMILGPMNKELKEMQDQQDRFVFDALNSEYNYVIEEKPFIRNSDQNYYYKTHWHLSKTSINNNKAIFSIKFGLEEIRKRLKDMDIDYKNITYDEFIQKLKGYLDEKQ